MGWSFKSIERVVENREMFENKKILTLGTLYPYVTEKEITLLKNIGINMDTNKIDFSRKFFCDFMNAECCHYLDVSDYQDSEVICNLNYPIPENLKAQYDVIIDAGTLEHVSNMSSGLLNFFNLLKLDGILYFGNPCNNWIDHGFFQFSPTFFKDLCIDNNDLELIELFISDNKNYFDITKTDINGYFMSVISASKNKFNVGGIIKKTGSNISLDLIQTKYRNLYEESDKTASDLITPMKKGYLPFFKDVLWEMTFWIISIPIVSIRYKFLLLDSLHKLKKRLFN